MLKARAYATLSKTSLPTSPYLKHKILSCFLYMEQCIVCVCVCVPLGHSEQSLRSEGALSVDVHGLPFSSTLIDRKLTRHRQRVAQLSLSCTELTEHLCDGARLYTAYTHRFSLALFMYIRACVCAFPHHSPCSSLSSSLEPVEIWMISALR